jgi:hypothetical protein
MTARVTKITDGTTTVDFESTTSGYVILRHRLATAQRDETSPELWTRVDEVLEISVEGSTQTELAQRLERLTQLIEQARRLMRGENVTPVIFQYRIDDSALADPLQSLIVGPAESGDVLTLPDSFDNYTQLKTGDAGDPVVWQFRRRGALLGDEETRSRTNGTINNPGVMTPSSNFTDTLTVPSPYIFSFTLSPAVGQKTDGLLLCAKSSSFLKLLEGEDGSGTNFSSEALATTESDSHVGRYSPADANPNAIEWTITGLDTSVRRLGVVINLQNHSSTITYKIRARCETGAYSRMRIVGTNDNNPQAFLYGIVASSYRAITTLTIEITAGAIGAGGNELDIDTIGIVALDNDAGNIIALRDLGITATDPIIDHASLTARRPIVRDNGNNGKSYSGNAYLSSLGNTAAFLMLANTLGEWNITDGAGTRVAVGFSMTRRPAYLIPR